MAAPKASGICYPFAAKCAMEHGGLVVHGTVSNSDNRSRRIPHAWVEHRGLVISALNDRVVLKLATDKFYGAYAAVANRRYQADEAMALAVHTGHWGPRTRAELRR